MNILIVLNRSINTPRYPSLSAHGNATPDTVHTTSHGGCDLI